MEVRVESVGDCYVLRLAGRMDGPGARKFHQATGALHNVQSSMVVIDLRETSALLAAGADAILRLGKQYRENGIGVAMVHCRPEAMQLMKAVGMTSFIPVFPSIDAAQSFFQSSKRRP